MIGVSIKTLETFKFIEKNDEIDVIQVMKENITNKEALRIKKKFPNKKIYVHADYNSSINNIKSQINFVKKIGGEALIWHLYESEFDFFDRNMPFDIPIFFENLANIPIKETAKMCKKLKAKMCFDTQHCFASGQKKIDQEYEKYKKIIGFVHINDSKASRGSQKDLHESLFDGKIPKKELINTIKKIDVNAVLETPNDQKKQIKKIFDYQYN